MTLDLPDVVGLAVPAFLAAMLLELVFIVHTRRGRYELRDTLASLAMGVGSLLFGALTGLFVATIHLWAYQHRLFDAGADWWMFLFAFVATDLAYYWSHRFSHERRWMWAEHVNHHSSQHYNLSTAVRQSWTGLVSGNWIFYLPITFLGVHPAILFFSKGLNLTYQFWVHTELIARLPKVLEWTLITPSHHRVHHAVNPRYLDANYGGVLILWDRLFGTFVAERAEDRPRFGIVGNLGTFNPIKVAFHEWWAIANDLRRARSVREAWWYMWGRPGWRPDGARRTSRDIKREVGLA
jgi:sterol desaturase/sphingolipid hydroxylase (fatty acid hydroxylase superfamily)